MKFMAFSACLMLLVAGCATERKKLTDDGKKVEVMIDKAHSGCNVVDKIVGENENGSVALATNHARNQAAKMGGNGLIANREVQNGSKVRVHATVYDCP